MAKRHGGLADAGPALHFAGSAIGTGMQATFGYPRFSARIPGRRGALAVQNEITVGLAFNRQRAVEAGDQ